MGSDVESLYTSREVVEVAKIVYDAVMKTEIKFENVDWMEKMQEYCTDLF